MWAAEEGASLDTTQSWPTQSITVMMPQLNDVELARPRRKLVIIIGKCLICLCSNLILDCRGHMRACARNKDIQRA